MKFADDYLEVGWGRRAGAELYICTLGDVADRVVSAIHNAHTMEELYRQLRGPLLR